MKRGGFTAVELATNLTVVAILIPLLYAGARSVQDNHALGLWHLQTADELRSLTEELRLDAQSGAALEGEEVAWSRGDCTVRYRVDPRRVLRREAPEACGGSRGLATNVDQLRRVVGGVEIEFARRLRPTNEQHTTVFIPLGTP